MTRKQALHIAIQLLEQAPEYSDAIQPLKDLQNELPVIHWTDASIKDTVEQFIVENERIPMASDFKKGGMPPHTVIKQHYGVTVSDWIKQNYPTKQSSFEEKKERYTNDFINDYNDIKPRSAKEFDVHKRKTTLGWQTIKKYHNVTTWRELLNKLNLHPYGDDPKIRTVSKFSVTVCSDYDFTE